MNWSYLGSFSLATLILGVACSSSTDEGGPGGPHAGAGGAPAITAGTSGIAGSPVIVGGSASAALQQGARHPLQAQRPLQAARAAMLQARAAVVRAAAVRAAAVRAPRALAARALARGVRVPRERVVEATGRSSRARAACAKQHAVSRSRTRLISIPPGYNGQGSGAGGDRLPCRRQRQHVDAADTSRGSDLAKKYFMVYPNSGDPEQRLAAVAADKSRYTDVQAAMLSQACVDENRLYGTGHSSGAQMVARSCAAATLTSTRSRPWPRRSTARSGRTARSRR